jgi:hypothetical protein
MNPILFFLPAIIVAAVLVVLGKEVDATALRRRRLTLFGVGLLSLVGLLEIISHSTTSTVWLLLQLFLLPYLITGVAGLLMRSGLQASLGISRATLVVSILLLGAVCFLVADFASYGLLAIVFAFFMAFTTTIVAVVVGIWLERSLKGKRRVVALLVGIVFPIGLFVSVQIGDSYSPEGQTRQHAEQAVQALDQYRRNVGNYPSSLSQIAPTYLTVVPEALTTQGTGWLYTATQDSFTLGYWYYPDKMGSDVCLYGSQNREWNCDFNNWGPFRFVPTPGPQ